MPHRRDMAMLLRLVPLSPVFALLAHSSSINSSLPHSIALGALLVPTMFVSARWFSANADEPSFELGFAALGVPAAASGAVSAAMAFGLVALAGRVMLELAQRAERWRVPAAVVGAALLVGLPFTAALATSAFYTEPASPIVYVYLIPHALLLAGWLRKAVQPLASPLPPEPWMRSIEWIGLAIVPVVYVILSLGALPYFANVSLSVSLWPPMVVLAGAAALVFAFRTRRLDLQPRVAKILDAFFSLDWLQYLASRVLQAIEWVFYFGSRLLEGNAGLLWAIMLVVLMLSLIAQFAFPG